MGTKEKAKEDVRKAIKRKGGNVTIDELLRIAIFFADKLTSSEVWDIYEEEFNWVRHQPSRKGGMK